MSALPMANADRKAAEVSQEFLEFAKQSFGVNLDFGVESLHDVDRYLEKVHALKRKQSTLLGRFTQKKISDEDLWQIIGLAGFYTGEVIRRHLATDHHWYEFVDWVKAFPGHQDFLGGDVEMGTAFVLGNDRGDLCLPFAKVGKYIENGSEDSVYYFARMFQAQEDQTSQA